MVYPWFDVDNSTVKLWCQNGANMSFFLATTDKKKPGLGCMLYKLAESSSQEVHTFQVCQSPDVAHHIVMIGPS